VKCLCETDPVVLAAEGAPVARMNCWCESCLRAASGEFDGARPSNAGSPPDDTKLPYAPLMVFTADRLTTKQGEAKLKSFKVTEKAKAQRMYCGECKTLLLNDAGDFRVLWYDNVPPGRLRDVPLAAHVNTADAKEGAMAAFEGDGVGRHEGFPPAYVMAPKMISYKLSGTF